MKKLIINADDLGISHYVNSQIEECIKQGVVTSSTLMANAPAFNDGVRIAKQYPQISIGVHLNVIEFAPLTNVDVFQRHGVCDEDGHFIMGAIFCVHIDDELRQAVYEEWDAQITKIEEAGIIPTHCDSHQHTHTITGLQEPLCEVLDKHGIKRVRRKLIPSIRLMLREKKRPAIQLVKPKAIEPQKRNVLYRRFHLFTVIRNCRKWNKQLEPRYILTNSFYPFKSYYYDRDILGLGKDSITELMCHPGHPSYQTETDGLLSRTWICSDVKLVSYQNI